MAQLSIMTGFPACYDPNLHLLFSLFAVILLTAITRLSALVCITFLAQQDAFCFDSSRPLCLLWRQLHPCGNIWITKWMTRSSVYLVSWNCLPWSIKRSRTMQREQAVLANVIDRKVNDMQKIITSRLELSFLVPKMALMAQNLQDL